MTMKPSIRPIVLGPPTPRALHSVHRTVVPAPCRLWVARTLLPAPLNQVPRTVVPARGWRSPLLSTGGAGDRETQSLRHKRFM